MARDEIEEVGKHEIVSFSRQTQFLRPLLSSFPISNKQQALCHPDRYIQCLKVVPSFELCRHRERDDLVGMVAWKGRLAYLELDGCGWVKTRRTVLTSRRSSAMTT